MAEKLRVCGGCGKTIPFNSTCECLKINKRERDKHRNKKSSVLTTSRYRRIRMEVIKRDGGFCQRCYKKFGIVNQGDLTVHHIKSREHYPELTYDKTNLITLCFDCNQQLGIKDKLDFEWVDYDNTIELEVY